MPKNGGTIRINGPIAITGRKNKRSATNKIEHCDVYIRDGERDTLLTTLDNLRKR